ncbi:MAG: hypothetical protein ACRC5A_04395 [Enterobacteriaceae bacterium]
MITTRFALKPHLNEWLRAKFNARAEDAIRLTPNSDLYILLWDLVRKRPAHAQVDRGNCEIALPVRREGKRPDSWNWLSQEAIRQFEKRVETLMWAEIHSYIDHQAQAFGYGYMTAIANYMAEYRLESISEDALQKHYYRWRRKVRPQSRRRYRAKDNPNRARIVKKRKKDDTQLSLFCQAI